MGAVAHARTRGRPVCKRVKSAMVRHVTLPSRPSLMQAPETPEAALRRIALAQDRAAFERLFLHFAPRIKSYLLRSGATAQQAEDLAQEAMLMVWRKAAQFDPARASAATWIFTIARNLRIDLIRRERHPGFDPADPQLAPPDIALADADVEAVQDARTVQAALRDLPSDQAAVIALFFFSDKPHSEIAAELDIPLGTVKSRLRLAMARLRAQLGGAP